MTTIPPCPQLSITLVHHNGWEALQNCLQSLYQNPPSVPFEVVLVDNVSTDGSVERVQSEFPEVKLLQSTQRAGFGANQNTAIRASQGDYILLLNDDTVVHPGALDALYHCLDTHPETAVVGPRLHNLDGTLQPSCYRFPSPFHCLWENLLLTAAFPNHPLFGDYRAWPHDGIRDVDFVVGAAILLRRSVLDKVGLFDPTFFMYAEETDLQYRIHTHGGNVLFCPEAIITHIGGQSTERMPERQFCEFQRSQAKFMRKHYGLIGAFVQRIAMLFGSLLRLTLWGGCFLFFPRRRAKARENLTTWTQLLRWWCGLGPHQGLEE